MKWQAKCKQWTHKLLQNLETQTSSCIPSAEVTSWRIRSSRSHLQREAFHRTWVKEETCQGWPLQGLLPLSVGMVWGCCVCNPLEQSPERCFAHPPPKQQVSCAWHDLSSFNPKRHQIPLQCVTWMTSHSPVYWSHFPYLSQDKAVKQLTEFQSKREATVCLELQETRFYLHLHFQN